MVKLDRSAVPLKSGKGIYLRLRVSATILSGYQRAARIILCNCKTIGLNANFGLTEPNRMIWPDFYIPNVTIFVFATI